MEIRNSEEPCAAAGRLEASNVVFRVSVFIFLLILAGCASPGEPVERKAAVPAAITDVAVQQSGNSAILTFTLPRETLERRSLKHTPDVEIYRQFSGAPTATPSAQETAPIPNASAAPSAPSSPPLLVTIPSALVSHYQQDGQIHYADAWTPEVLTQHAGGTAVYIVRTSESPKKQSPDSNSAGIRVYAAPGPISDLRAALSRSGVDLSWSAPQQTPVGPEPSAQEYQIDRVELSSATSGEKSAAPRQQGFQLPGAKTATARPEQIGTSQTPGYHDAQVSLGAIYEYFVRSVVEYSGESVASEDSNRVTIIVRDVFPPSTPTGLVAVPVPAEHGNPAHIDLSWNISAETDVAGYNVYRTEQENTGSARLNSQPLPTPAFSDMTAVAGQRYVYRITAVDRSANESERSTAVSAEVPAESQPKP